MDQPAHPTPPEPTDPDQTVPPASEATPPALPFPVEEEMDLNDLFPGTEQDLNELFPEKELRTLLKKVHKSQKDLHKINTRFVDDTEHVVPHLDEAEDPETEN